MPSAKEVVKERNLLGYVNMLLFKIQELVVHDIEQTENLNS